MTLVISAQNTRIHGCTWPQDVFSIFMTLEEIESQLNPRDFFRVNRQTIISIHVVIGLKTWFGSKLRVRLANYPDTEMLCSREKAAALKTWLGR